MQKLKKFKKALALATALLMTVNMLDTGAAFVYAKTFENGKEAYTEEKQTEEIKTGEAYTEEIQTEEKQTEENQTKETETQTEETQIEEAEITETQTEEAQTEETQTEEISITESDTADVDGTDIEHSEAEETASEETTLSDTSEATGAFTVTGGTLDTDYTYADNVLTIKTVTALTIANRISAATTDTIVVDSGDGADIILDGVNIDVSSMDDTCAFKIANASGDVKVTLSGKNILKSGYKCAGLQKENDDKLEITGTGSLDASGGYSGAGIGGGTNGYGENIEISGGTVTASGGSGAAGIGGGYYGAGENIEINGGTVTASGGNIGAGIGGGAFGAGENIAISGGSVKAVAGVGANKIGGGYGYKAVIPKNGFDDDSKEVYLMKIYNLNDETVVIDGKEYTPSSHKALNDKYLYAYVPVTKSNTCDVNVGNDTVTWKFINGMWGIDGADLIIKANDGAELTKGDDYEYIANNITGYLTVKTDKAVTISMAEGVTKTADTIVIDNKAGADITLAGVNIDVSDVNDAGALRITSDTAGNVKVRLAAASKNILKSGYGCAGLQKESGADYKLEITGTGALDVSGGDGGSGIGGGNNGSGDNIEISGGTVSASGGVGGSGIGGGYYGFGKNIEISGGTVSASGGNNGSGIGGGYCGSGKNIEISGGTVNASGGEYGAGIGGGGFYEDEIEDNIGTGENIKISGGIVSAKGGKSGSGIGGGYYRAGLNIEISGGSVKAVAGDNANAIGGGRGRDAVTPTSDGETPVYLLEIKNPKGEDITINDKKYPSGHFDEKKIYAYLPEMTKDRPNVVMIGEGITGYYHDTDGWKNIIMVLIPENDETKYVYNGKEQEYTLTESKYYTITGNKQKKAGTYTVTVSITKEADMWSDGTTADKKYEFVIEKAQPLIKFDTSKYSMICTGNAVSDETLASKLTITADGEFEYDGESKYLYSYREKASQDAFKAGLPFDIGEYEIKAEIAEQDNYKAATATADLTIDWLASDKAAELTNTPNVKGTAWTKRITLTAPAGFEISYEMDNAYTSSITYDTETDENGKELTYYLKNSDGELARKTVTVYIDKTAPKLTDITTPSESEGTLTQTGADISFKADEAGTYYYVVRETAQSAPAADEFFKESEKDGYAIWSAKDGILCAQMSEGEANTVTLDGLTENTSYTLYVILLDNVGNASEVYKKEFSTPEKEEAESSEPDSSDDGNFSDEKLEVTVSNIKAKVYDQNAYEPTVKVTVTQTVNGKKKKVTLTEGGDYSISYKDNVNAGTGKVIITGEGDYKGVTTKEFTIAKKSVKKLKIAAGSISGEVNLYDLSTLPVYVYDGTACLKYGIDYKLTDCTTAKNGKTAQVMLEGLGNYKDASKIKLKIYDSGKTIISPENVKLLDETPVYTGKAVTPKIEVNVDGTVLTEKTDYTVKYVNNKEAGTAYVTVTGKGDYAGEAAVPFMIKAFGENELIISEIKAAAYKGKLQKPSVSVSIQKDGKVKKLIKYKDYTVTYANNFHAGEATVIITGKGNYAGLSGEKHFTINPVEIKKASVKGTKDNLVITYAKRTLKEGRDYTTEYGEEKSGKVSVTIKGNGDFTGEVIKKVKLF